jgi:hypothetical protein
VRLGVSPQPAQLGLRHFGFGPVKPLLCCLAYIDVNVVNRQLRASQQPGYLTPHKAQLVASASLKVNNGCQHVHRQ